MKESSCDRICLWHYLQEKNVQVYQNRFDLPLSVTNEKYAEAYLCNTSDKTTLEEEAEAVEVK